MAELADLTLVETADAIVKGEVASEVATLACLDRLRRHGPSLNCVIRLEAQEAVEAARAADRERKADRLRGPLHGVPLAHKDLFLRQGKVVTCGAKLTRDFVPDRTSTALERLAAAGAIHVAALHPPEFARSATGHNDFLGPCRNPWNKDFVSGGSSSGSAAAVAARLVPASLGTDTGGSIRLPAAMCGIVGLMPTRSRVSVHGVMPVSWSLDVVGPLARTAGDCARLLSVIAGFDPADSTTSRTPVPDYERAMPASIKGLRIGVPQNYYYDSVTDEVRRRLEVFRSLGAATVETTIPDIAFIDDVQHVVREVEAATVHARWLRTRPLDYSDEARGRLEPGLFHAATRYLRLLTPCTRHVNFLGVPVVAAPCGFTANGLPVGFQLLGRPFAEATLLGTVAAFQRATDWHRRRPDLGAGSKAAA